MTVFSVSGSCACLRTGTLGTRGTSSFSSAVSVYRRFSGAGKTSCRLFLEWNRSTSFSRPHIESSFVVHPLCFLHTRTHTTKPMSPHASENNRAEQHSTAQNSNMETTAQTKAKIATFGLVADIQYWDGPDATNFHGTAVRRYRNSLECTKMAVASWEQTGVDFIVQLGDVIDGKNAGHTTGAPDRKAEEALRVVLDTLHGCSCKVFLHILGNHELYNFSREQLEERLGSPPFGSTSPVRGFRFVTLDPYEISTICPSPPHTTEEAYTYLEARNPNNMRGPANWTEGLEGLDRRFVPYNGAMGPQQIQWLRSELEAAQEKKERVVILCHIALCPGAQSDDTCLLWNYDEVLAMIREFTCVVAVFSGHFHEGGYAVDDVGVHHVVFQSPLESEAGQGAWGTVDIFEDRMELKGYGRAEISTRTLTFRHMT